MTNKLYEQLNRETEHVRLTPAEKQAMRAAIFGAPSPLLVAAPRRRSPYMFMSSGWVRALAALIIIATAGTGTAFASEGALPGQPLYAIKTNVVEPVKLALATSAAAKAAVQAQLAQERVAEAEALAQRGTLDASTSAELADAFEAHAKSAFALANEASTTDPAVATEVRARLAVSSSVGSAVLVALANGHDDHGHAASIAARVLAFATTANDGSDFEGQGSRHAFKAAVSTDTHHGAVVHTMAFATNASGTAPSPMAAPTATAGANLAQQKAALELSTKVASTFDSLKSQFAQASSTLDATTTVSIETTMQGIDALVTDGQQALKDSLFDTAVQDFAQALGQTLKLSALLDAELKYNHNLIDPFFNGDDHGVGSGDSSGGQGDASASSSGEVHVNL
jgi:hypothetical protein